MRAVVQRVSHASVEVEAKIVGEISNGLLILLGIGQEDDHSDIEWLVKKIGSMRIFSDSEGKMNLSLMDLNYECLIVSQFTLLASTRKGNRPSFIQSAPPEQAEALYEEFVSQFRSCSGCNVETGEFGEYMQIRLVNDGPVTIIIDSKTRE